MWDFTFNTKPHVSEIVIVMCKWLSGTLNVKWGQRGTVWRLQREGNFNFVFILWLYCVTKDINFWTLLSTYSFKSASLTCDSMKEHFYGKIRENRLNLKTSWILSMCITTQDGSTNRDSCSTREIQWRWYWRYGIPLWDNLNQSFYLNNVVLWEEGVDNWKKQWTMIAKVAFFLTYYSNVRKMGKVSDILSRYVEVLYPCYPLMS